MPNPQTLASSNDLTAMDNMHPTPRASSSTKNNDGYQQRTNTDKNLMDTQSFSIPAEHAYQGVIEWLLPYDISQSTLSGQISGSNACTVKSVLGAIQVSNNNLAFPSPIRDLPEIITFSNTMIEGNRLQDYI